MLRVVLVQVNLVVIVGGRLVERFLRVHCVRVMIRFQFKRNFSATGYPFEFVTKMHNNQFTEQSIFASLEFLIVPQHHRISPRVVISLPSRITPHQWRFLHESSYFARGKWTFHNEECPLLLRVGKQQSTSNTKQCPSLNCAEWQV
mmetsp:Transcript_9827/g.36651  ORF Transcript_9827/g.36651 Transcript_9827/m.36651 type:complete len:146 (+) Transcript_9827:147-584(+)